MINSNSKKIGNKSHTKNSPNNDYINYDNTNDYENNEMQPTNNNNKSKKKKNKSNNSKNKNQDIKFSAQFENFEDQDETNVADLIDFENDMLKKKKKLKHNLDNHKKTGKYGKYVDIEENDLENNYDNNDNDDEYDFIKYNDNDIDDDDNNDIEEPTLKSNMDEDVSYYKILGVPPDASQEIIRKQFKKLTVKYHPDKPDGDANIFALIAKIYACLSNKERRSEYDRLLNIEKKTKKNNFFSQKKSFNDYIKSTKSSKLSKSDKKFLKSKYKFEQDEFDKKRGFDREKLKDPVLSPEDALKRMRDLEMARGQSFIELLNPSLFEKMDPDKFNALFELKYKDTINDKSMINYNGFPSAFNVDNDSAFISLTNDRTSYDDLFEEGDNIRGNEFYASIKKDFGRKVNVTKYDLEKLTSQNKSKYSNYDIHNNKDDNYNNELLNNIKQRDLLDKEIKEKGLSFFNTEDKTYEFLHHVGLTGKELQFENEDIDADKIKKFIEQRQLDYMSFCDDEERPNIPKKSNTKKK